MSTEVVDLEPEKYLHDCYVTIADAEPISLGLQMLAPTADGKP